MHAQASHPQYLYHQQQQQQQQQQLLMNAAAPNGSWFLPNNSGLSQSLINPLVTQAGTFGQDRTTMAAAAAAVAATQQQGTQALLSHLASLAPQQPATSIVGVTQPQQPQQQQPQQQHPNYMFMAQQWQQQLQQQQQQQQQQAQHMAHSLQLESDKKGSNVTAAPSLESSFAMPPPRSAPIPLGQPSASLSSAQPRRLQEPQPSLPPNHADHNLQTPQLAGKEMNPPLTSRSTSSTTTSTPPLMSAAVAETGLRHSHNNSEPDQIPPTADTSTIPPARPASVASISPALSAAANLSKNSPKLAKGSNSKDTKHKAGITAPLKSDAAVLSPTTTVVPILITKRKTLQPMAIKKARTTPAQVVLHSGPQPCPMPASVDTAPATPLVSSIAPPLPSNQLASNKLPRAASTTSITAVEALGSAPRPPLQATTSDLPPVPLLPAQLLDALAPGILSDKEVLGRGIEQLLKFHSILVPSNDAPSLEYWTAAISDKFCDIGNIRLELGAQSYDMPVAAACGFYQRLFSEGAVVSIHVALGQPKLYRLKQNSSILSFHGVHMTTTYVNGRRVLETGDLRVIFGEDFRIRLWAFSSEDATVCLPRKRSNGTDEALTRTCEATIGRNLDWPNTQPAPKRRKTANGKQPPDECALPACALQHLEIANTMYYLQELIELQLQNKTSTLGIMDLWMKAAKPEPLTAAAAKQLTRATGSERKPRSRKKSTVIPLLPAPPPVSVSASVPVLATARSDDAEPSTSDSKAKVTLSAASPVVPALIVSKPARQQTKHL
ncbi:hypothetical protein IWW38_002037 [Coemansia aciculifera]|uniref:Uncharacterized protein n=1 Tax=Coemansia aciculifera TaxID=417176 RepID=A0ACC1M6J2_9FUNG|nr:hypothetical protein IWW38_002037 [Coemansia aciculifera]